MYEKDSFEEYLAREDFNPEIIFHKDLTNAYKSSLDYVCNEILSNPNITKDDIISDYFNNYNSYSELFFIDELFDIYNDSKQLVLLEHDDNNQYTEEEFLDNGFIKSTYIIHKHDRFGHAI